MLISRVEYDRFVSRDEMLTEAIVETASLKAEIRYLKEMYTSLQIEHQKLKDEKDKIFDDLMIAVGVKQTSYQEELLKRQAPQSEIEPDFSGQARHWTHMRTGEAMKILAGEQNKWNGSIEELEKEALS